MRLTGAHDLALHVYQLVIVRDDIELEYATIMEAHHPEYLVERELLETFDYDANAALSPADLKSLSKLVFSPENRT